jgi:hypothetical protein
MIRKPLFPLSALCLLLLSACVTTPFKQVTEPLITNLVGFTPLYTDEAGATHYQISILYQNPNPIAVSTLGTWLNIEVLGAPFASILSQEPLVFPAYGELRVPYEASSSRQDILVALAQRQATGSGGFPYKINGKVSLSNDLDAIEFSSNGVIGVISPTGSSTPPPDGNLQIH